LTSRARHTGRLGAPLPSLSQILSNGRAWLLRLLRRPRLTRPPGLPLHRTRHLLKRYAKGRGFFGKPLPQGRHALLAQFHHAELGHLPQLLQLRVAQASDVDVIQGP